MDNNNIDQYILSMSLLLDTNKKPCCYHMCMTVQTVK